MSQVSKDIVTRQHRTTATKTQRKREDAGATVLDQQMRPAETRYPVDRYLVESSKKFDMVNIIDDDIWNSEPALRPEDEIILRKLHDMLQSTADDLKLLSGELSKYHESDTQKKTLPTPLDEEFNEKIHIEEVVNAKFHGHNIIETESTSHRKHRDVFDGIIQSIANKQSAKQFVNHGVQVNQVPFLKNPPIKKNLAVSRTNVIQIAKPSETKTIVNSNEKSKKKNNNSVIYNEFSYKYAEPKPTFAKKPLQIQQMPSINIRSELKEQRVLQLNINPESKEVCENENIKSNALVVEMKHEDTPKPASKKPITFDHIQYIPLPTGDKPITRKISKMSAYESESTNNGSSESQDNLRRKIKNTMTLRPSASQGPSQAQNTKKNITNKKNVKREGKKSLDEWQSKLNSVYGGTSKINKSGVKTTKAFPKSGKQTATSRKKVTSQILNNTDYIPYSKLTIGGVNVSDIEREISNIPNRGDIVLSPILDKILSSRENSFHKDSPRKTKNKSPRILTTSDENLLQEVLDIEKEISRTISTKNENNVNKISDNDEIDKNRNLKNADSYDDDFEEEKSNDSEQAKESHISKSESLDSIPPNKFPFNSSNEDDNYDPNNLPNSKTNQENNANIHNKTYTKISNLSFKNTVDIFEFVHSVDTQDTATQINASNKATHQENQTSSSDDKSNVLPIHNDLWPSIDPHGKVEKMFKLEKELIKKLILEEYGDLLEKQLNKPSTSKNVDNSYNERNIISSQKNTQTSPAHVKSVMTSPTRTKTRTTSPFALALSVNQQTSPIVVVSNEEEMKVEIENDDDLGISVNLSSPRFSLRLPQTSREVLSNIKSENSNRNKSQAKFLRKNILSSSSSGEGDYSSSDISSLGQIHKIYKRRLRKSRIPSLSEISSSSSLSRYSRYSTDRSGVVIPLKSEGEASIEMINTKRLNKQSKSEGEMSLGQLN